MENKQIIKWVLELTNQEQFKSPAEVVRAYNIQILGC